MIVLDGREIRAPHETDCDVAVVGSGPAGATAARALARAGARVTVIEEGPWVRPEQFPADAFTAMTLLYRRLGATVFRGRAPAPYVQGRAVGGTSVVNGAICWRLPREVRDEWVAADPALADALPWETLVEIAERIESDLNVQPTDPSVAGPKNALMAAGAEALGLEHRPVRRNVRGCRGLGRCLQGCPEGNKLSMDRTYLPDACRHGARIFSGVAARRIVVERGRAVAIDALSDGGARVRVRCSGAVVVAAGAVQTPLLLLRSRLRQGPVGANFQCHPGVSVAARFPDPVETWRGATQGHEVLGLRPEGIKMEVLGFDRALVAARVPGVGPDFLRELPELRYWADWGALVRSRARGRVAGGWGGEAVRFAPTREDMLRMRKAVRVLGEMMLAAGARVVAPGVSGWHERVTDRRVMARFEDEGPLDPRAYSVVVTHMFGTCAASSDPARGVVRPDLRHHAVEGLYVADSSVFPTNLGVNPQIAIMTIAEVCGRRVLEAG